MCPLLVQAQSHDFEIKNFQENVTDLSAISSLVNDINGKPTALIRFSVRDPLFEFDANLGIVKQEKKTGEVWLYVPSGTKRLNISHPHLGVLRGYKIPISVEGKCTYDAEIEITNTLYLQSLYTNYNESVIPPAAIITLTPEDSLRQTDMQDDVLIDNLDNKMDSVIVKDSIDIIKVSGDQNKDSVKTDSVPLKSIFQTPHRIDVYAGVGFNALSLMGPSIALGVNYYNINVEANFVYGLEKVENIGINYALNSSEGFLGEVYDYTCSRLSIRAGYVVLSSRSFMITPMAGIAFNMINGDQKIKNNKQDQFSSITQMSAFVGLTLDLKLGKTMHLYVAPQYYFPVGTNNAYKVIKEVDNKIKNWCEGFGFNAGIKLHF